MGKIKNNSLNSKKWLKSDRNDRLFIFVDESGDPGLSSLLSSSKYFNKQPRGRDRMVLR
jgi:hypothetical protein